MSLWYRWWGRRNPTYSHIVTWWLTCLLYVTWWLNDTYIWFNWHLLHLAQILLSYCLTVAYGPYFQLSLKALESVSRKEHWRIVIYFCLSFPMPQRSPNSDIRIKSYGHFTKTSRRQWYQRVNLRKIWVKPTWIRPILANLKLSNPRLNLDL